jgi:Bacterial Ig domain
MSNAITRIAAATVVTVVAGLGLTGSAGSATAATGGPCEGQSAPANTNVANQAPVATDDTVNMVAGTLRTLKVLANDTDPDGDKLYLENATSPRRGEICVQRNGTVQILAPASPSAYTTAFTYGVTDGDRYRTATVTVNVSALKPLRPVLEKRLVLKKHGHKVKQRARVSFTNPNKVRLLLLAGNPRKDRPAVQRYVYPGHSVTFTTKDRKIVFLTVLLPKSDDYFTFVSQGRLDTRTGAKQIHYVGETFSENLSSEARTAARAWARR